MHAARPQAALQAKRQLTTAQLSTVEVHFSGRYIWVCALTLAPLCIGGSF